MNAHATFSSRFEVGAPVIGHGEKLGYIVSAEAQDLPLFTIGAGGMTRDRLKLTVAFEDSLSIDLSEGIVSPWRAKAEARDLAQCPDIEMWNARAEAANRARRERVQADHEERARQEAAFREEARRRIPDWAKAVIVAELDEDDSDLMTDYWGHKTLRTVIIGFSRHTRDLFPEMRKAAALFPETADLADAPEDAEHREKYSMGAGYYLKRGYRDSSGWKVSKHSLYGRGADGCPVGEFFTPDEAAEDDLPMIGSNSANAGAYRIEQHTHTKHGFDMWIAIPAERAERDAWEMERDRAKALGGWWSKAWGKTPGGFAFKAEQSALQFVGEGTPPDRGNSDEPPARENEEPATVTESLTVEPEEDAPAIEMPAVEAEPAAPEILEDEPAAESVGELVPSATLASIEAARDGAISKLISAYDHYHAAIADAVRLIPGDRRPWNDDIERAFLRSAEHRSYDRESGTHEQIDGRTYFERVTTKAVDRCLWRYIIQMTDLERMMDRQAHEEFETGLNDNPPEVRVETVKATLGDLYRNRRHIRLRGIANVFQKLDRRFRSHDGFKVGDRLIIDRALGEYGWQSYTRRDTLRDVERVFLELDGKSPVAAYGSIAQAIEDTRKEGTPRLVHGDYFRVRVFGNGNLHLWFERKDLLRDVNALLGEWYGEALGEGADTAESDRAPRAHLTPAKNFGYFGTSEDVAEKVLDRAYLKPGMRVLEPSAGRGGLAMPARGKNCEVTCVEIQPGFANELRDVHGFNDVRCGDFLKMQPSDLGQFDAVIMNPPFDRRRDCDHVLHALQFVKPGGLLVAIMAAGLEFRDDARSVALRKAIEKWEPKGSWRSPYVDLAPGSFAHAGTNVNTMILAVRRPA